MLKIGITGGIGSGKSTIARIFHTLGIPVYDADAAAKELMENDLTLRQKLVNHFGEATYANGVLNRPYLAGIVFNNHDQLDILNALVHPVTIGHAARWMQKQTAPYVLKEAALLFESSAKDDLDFIIGVSAPRHLRIKRAMERDAISREDVIKRISRQIDEDIKMRLCDFVIVNDEQQLVIPQVLALHEKFLQKATALQA